MAKNLPHVDTDALSQRITRTPFPGSRKVYLDGSSPDIRVPFREITLGDTLVDDGAGGSRREPNPPLRVYDASGPYTDPQAAIDITCGLPPKRALSRWDLPIHPPPCPRLAASTPSSAPTRWPRSFRGAGPTR